MCIVQYSTGYSYGLLLEVIYVYSTEQVTHIVYCQMLRMCTVHVQQGTHSAYFQRLLCAQYSTVQDTDIVYYQRLRMCTVQYSTLQGTNIVYYHRLCMCTFQYSKGYSYCFFIRGYVRVQYSTVQYRVLILFIIRGYVCVQYSTVKSTHIVYY